MNMNKIGIILSVVVGSYLTLACTSTDNEEITESAELYQILIGNKFGFIDEKGKLAIEPQFDNVYWFFGDSVCFARLGARKGLINTKGEFIVELNHDIELVYQFINGMAVVHTSDGKYGVISKSGKYIIPAIYNITARDGNMGFIVEDSLGNRGYINTDGECVVPCKYDAVTGFHDGLMMVATSNKCGYVDTTGTFVIDTIYDDARSFGNGLARVKIDSRWVFINKRGRVVDKLQYDEILTGFSCNRAFVKNGDAIELINRKGEKIATLEADSVCGYEEDFATFKGNGRWGVLDTMGTATIAPKYDELSSMVNGLARFSENGKWGAIDSTGNVMIKAAYDYVIDLGQSLITCIDTCEYKRAYYDRSGKLIWRESLGSRWPNKPSKEDYIKDFDSRLSELDPIEGIYYVTWNYFDVSRENDHITTNQTESWFGAVRRKPGTDDFYMQVVDSVVGREWVKKFVHIGETNTYAVVNNTLINENKNNWAEDGKLILEDPNKFEVTLRTGGNDYYNFYVRCEFTKDYPSTEIYEQVQKAEWTGTGFAIADGYVVTNYHVTNGAKTIRVRGINGEINDSYKGYVVASDREHDLAIIKILDKKFDGFKEIPYGIGKRMPEVGDNIFVLGYPLVQTMGNEIKLTEGIISAESGYKGDNTMYQISAAVQPGNSGGPLFDSKGNVIGIVCAKHSDAENANYAIKISYLFSLLSSNEWGIAMPSQNSLSSKSLSKQVKLAKPFVYLIECNSH